MLLKLDVVVLIDNPLDPRTPKEGTGEQSGVTMWRTLPGLPSYLGILLTVVRSPVEKRQPVVVPLSHPTCFWTPFAE